MLLLLDIGNTHTHVALAKGRRLLRPANFPTTWWMEGQMIASLQKHLGPGQPKAAAFCSVVPQASHAASQALGQAWGLQPFQLNAATLRGVGIDYPKPGTIGADRLANAVAAREQFGAPSVVVDFGTAVTFDVVNRTGNYVGGIIAPGLAAMTSYLHEKTALLPEIKVREIREVIGKSTEQAMLVGAVHGYRGLVRELIAELKRELNFARLPVVATGGYARIMAAKLPEISAVDPLLTLKGLRRAWDLREQPAEAKRR